MDMSADDIFSEIKFVYICFGIILPVIIVFGLVGNVLALCVLCHRSLRSAPVCLLQALTFNDLLILSYSVYSDVQPSIVTYNKANRYMELLKSLETSATSKTRSTVRTTTKAANIIDDRRVNVSFLYQQIFSLYQKIKHINFTLEEDGQYGIVRTPTNNSNNMNISIECAGCTLCNDCTSMTLNKIDILSIPQTEINEFIVKRLETFIAYTIIHFGILIALTLATERSVAVWFPLKASSILTISRTRLTIVVIFFCCLLVHLPQLINDVYLVKTNPQQLLKDQGSTTLLDHRLQYDRFYAISNIVICSMLLLLNSALLYKLVALQKRLKSCRHIQTAQRQEINITLVIVILLFCQIPVYTCIIIFAFMQREQFDSNISAMTKISVVFRMIFVSQSAFNFIIYCLFAKNVRKVIKHTYIKIIEAVSVNEDIKLTVTKSGRRGSSVTKGSSDRTRPNSFCKSTSPNNLDVIKMKDFKSIQADMV